MPSPSPSRGGDGPHAQPKSPISPGSPRSPVRQDSSRSLFRNRDRDRESSPPPSTFDKLVPGIIDTAKDLTDIIVQVSGFIPIPGVSIAAQTVKRILLISEQIIANKGDAQSLAFRCADLLPIFKIGLEKLSPSDAKLYGDRVVATFEKVEKQYTQWAGWSAFNQAVHFRSIGEKIAGLKGEVALRLQDFQTVAILQSATWQERETEERRKDFDTLMKNIVNWSTLSLQAQQNTSGTKALASATVEDVRKLGVSEQEWEDYMGLLQTRLQTKPRASSGTSKDEEERRALQTMLLNIILATGNLPPNIQISGKCGEVEKVGEYPSSTGTNYDVYKGRYLGAQGRDVALKYLRVTQPVPGRPGKVQFDLKHFVQEAKLWRTVWDADKGRYIQEFIGIVIDDGPYPYMVSPWWKNGTAIQWVSNPANREMVDRKALVLGIAEGLNFLHNWTGLGSNPKHPGIVHGDVRGVNVLINDEGRPLISDFSLSKILESLTGVSLTAASGASEFRWTPPEVANEDQPRLTPKSDVWSFGMCMLELISTQQPYSEFRNSTRVLFAITTGIHPRRPTLAADPKNQKVLDECWSVMTECCWNMDASARSSMADIVRRLGGSV